MCKIIRPSKWDPSIVYAADSLDRLVMEYINLHRQ